MTESPESTRASSRGVAGMLAERLERLCAAGIARRAAGGCEEPGVSDSKHGRLGHDAGCMALGVPRRALDWTVTTWDTVGAAPLLLEALDEAIASIVADGVWSESAARDALAFALRRRITPSAS